MAVTISNYQSAQWRFDKDENLTLEETWGKHNSFQYIGTVTLDYNDNPSTTSVLGLKCTVDKPIKAVNLKLYAYASGAIYGGWIHITNKELTIDQIRRLSKDGSGVTLPYMKMEPGVYWTETDRVYYVPPYNSWTKEIVLADYGFVDSTGTLKDGLPAGNIYVYFWSKTTNAFYVDMGDNYTGSEKGYVSRIISATEIPYTAPTAPTSISGSATYTKPGDKITVSWSGAAAGVSNAITKYKLVFSGAVSATVYSSATNSTSGSYTYTIPSGATRGSALKVVIYTQGTVSGFTESSASSIVTVTTINKLPTFTSAALNKTVFKSAESTATVIFTGANANNSGQTLTYQYSHDNSSWDTISSSIVSLQAASSDQRTMYFRIYDGLEYSTVKSQTYHRYTAPSVSIDDGASISSAYGISATASASGGNINEAYSYAWEYNGRPIGTSSTSLSEIDVKNYGVNWGVGGTLKVTVTSNGESKSAETTVTMPDAPTALGFFNSSDFLSVAAGGATDYFYQDLSFQFTANNAITSKNNVAITCTDSGGNPKAVTISYFSTTGVKFYVDSGATTPNTRYTFVITLKNGSLSKPFTYEKTRAPHPENIGDGASFTIKYENRNNYASGLNITNVFGDKGYCIDTFNSAPIRFIVPNSLNGTTWEPSFTRAVIDSDTIKLTLDLSYPDNPLNLNLEGGEYVFPHKLIITNVFGEEITFTGIGTTSFDWRANVIATGLSVEGYGNAVSEGDTLSFILNGVQNEQGGAPYYPATLSYTINMIIDGTSTQIKTSTASTEDISNDEHKTLSLGTYTVPQITSQTTSVQFTISYSTTKQSQSSNFSHSTTAPLVYAAAPSGLIISSANYEDVLSASVKWSSYNTYMGSALLELICDGITLASKTPGAEDTSASFSEVDVSSWGEWTSKLIYVRLTATSSEGTSYSTNSAVITVYNIAPTVAYRHNALGINTKNLEITEAILEIHPTNEKKKVVIYLDPNLGLDPIVIDTASGAVSGLVISGGSW